MLMKATKLKAKTQVQLYIVVMEYYAALLICAVRGGREGVK